MAQPLAALFGRKPPVPKSADLERILALPRRPRVEPGTATAAALIQHVTAAYTRGPRQCRCAKIQADYKVAAKPCITELNYAQAWSLHEMTLVGGEIGQLAVGSGKSLLDILAPLAIPNCRRAVALVPATLVRQLAVEYDLVAEHFRVPTIVYHAGAKSPPSRTVPGAPVLHILPYSRFQRGESTVILETMQPDLIIADEAQALSSFESTRTNRFLRYAIEAGVRVCAWSGTLTNDEIQDYAHLSTLALGEGSPLPNDPEEVDNWGLAINPDDYQAEPGALEELCQGDEDYLDAFHRRLVETRGFVATSGASISNQLVARERKAPPLPEVIQHYLGQLRGLWVRPDGEELVEALAVKRCARELACGLYLRWRFENGETETLIKEWLEARKLWRRELREKLKRREPHLDSPMLCALAAARAWGQGGPVTDVDDEGRAVTVDRKEVPLWKAEAWPRWRAVRDQVRPKTESIRVDPFLANDAAAWAHENRGVVWYQTVAFGQWVAEISNLPMHGGGPDAGERIAKEKGDRSIVASIASHGTGRDGLQRLFCTQLVTQFPGSAVGCEQLLGRLSRIGQDAPVVSAWVYRHTPETRELFDNAWRKTTYVSKTMGQPMKIQSGWVDE